MTQNAAAASSMVNSQALIDLGYGTKEIATDIVYFAVGSAYGAAAPFTAPVEKVFWEQFAVGKVHYNKHAKEHVDKAHKAVTDVYELAKNAIVPVFLQIKEVASGIGQQVAN